jgi:hypothetical protein
MARLEAKTPFHACPYENPENDNTIEIRGNRYEKSRLIYLFPLTILYVLRKV